ncbi:MAG: hypothetical protein J3K34DRAFT_377827 [Monoraphidium minutum]|nr:MAG: hypothetical protein J3K34DRAFT_377827 [Monoraphidium minutum]
MRLLLGILMRPAPAPAWRAWPLLARRNSSCPPPARRARRGAAARPVHWTGCAPAEPPACAGAKLPARSSRAAGRLAPRPAPACVRSRGCGGALFVETMFENPVWAGGGPRRDHSTRGRPARLPAPQPRPLVAPSMPRARAPAAARPQAPGARGGAVFLGCRWIACSRPHDRRRFWHPAVLSLWPPARAAPPRRPGGRRPGGRPRRARSLKESLERACGAGPAPRRAAGRWAPTCVQSRADPGRPAMPAPSSPPHARGPSVLRRDTRPPRPPGRAVSPAPSRRGGRLKRRIGVPAPGMPAFDSRQPITARARAPFRWRQLPPQRRCTAPAFRRTPAAARPATQTHGGRAPNPRAPEGGAAAGRARNVQS